MTALLALLGLLLALLLATAPRRAPEPAPGVFVTGARAGPATADGGHVALVDGLGAAILATGIEPHGLDRAWSVGPVGCRAVVATGCRPHG